MKYLNIAIAGFRHMHIVDLYQRTKEHPCLNLTQICEGDVSASLLPSLGIEPDFESLERMLGECPCDIVALGGRYGDRGRMALEVLRSKKHVIADKPLCTSLDELNKIEALAQENNLRVGLMLDLRDSGNLIALKDIVASGRIGEVQTVTFSAQHPLLPGTRPGWYFEPGMHGGTLNDIAVHAMDFLPWVTGLEIAETVAARTWNAKAKDAPHFHDCGQLMLRLSNGGGVLGDVSYLAPDACGYKIDNYWRITIHGTCGFVETSHNRAGITFADDKSPVPQPIPAAPPRPGGYLQDFLDDIAGNPRPGGLDTEACLAATRRALVLELKAQKP